MHAELATIEDTAARRTFARSGAGAALRHGFGIRIGFALLTGVLVATVTLAASRLQLADGGRASSRSRCRFQLCRAPGRQRCSCAWGAAFDVVCAALVAGKMDAWSPIIEK